MNHILESQLKLNRRHFFGQSAAGIGTAALASLLGENGALAAPEVPGLGQLVGGNLHHPAKAKRVIYLFQSGAPSQQDLFDHKPDLQKYAGEELGKHVEMNERKTGMSKGQKSFPIAGTFYDFKQHGQSGATVSSLLPNIARISDQLCFIKSMQTDHINHDPAITFFQTGHQLAGRPSMGSWLSYGLGSENEDLPSFVAMVSRGSGRPNCQPLYDRLWGSGFLPTEYAGVKFMSVGEPVLYLKNPAGMDRSQRRTWLDRLAEANASHHAVQGDPQIDARIKAYELAYRMQASVPELTDISDEPKHILELYGPDVQRRGSYAYNCLIARRLAERDVRFIQLFHMGWDQHFTLPKQLPGQCKDTDQATAALITDLAQRGLLDDTLVVWGGEFGRTTYCQGALNKKTYGRDHHPRCFTIFMTGAGIKRGMTHGATDAFSYNVIKDPVHVHDLHATILHQLGIDHERLTYKFQGRYFRLTDVHGNLIKSILA